MNTGETPADIAHRFKELWLTIEGALWTHEQLKPADFRIRRVRLGTNEYGILNAVYCPVPIEVNIRGFPITFTKDISLIQIVSTAE